MTIEPEFIATIEGWETKYSEEPVDVYQTMYMSVPVIALLVAVRGTHEHVCTPTVNLSAYGDFPQKGHVFIKDYEENEGVRQALETAGVIGPAVSTRQAGFAEVTEHKLLIRGTTPS